MITKSLVTILQMVGLKSFEGTKRMEKNLNHIECNYQLNHKTNPWREFVSEMWFKHKDEVLAWEKKAVTNYTIEDYYHKNKWYLKQQFRKKGGKVYNE